MAQAHSFLHLIKLSLLNLSDTVFNLFHLPKISVSYYVLTPAKLHTAYMIAATIISIQKLNLALNMASISKPKFNILVSWESVLLSHINVIQFSFT
jgi:hypothetical protein